MGLKQLQQLKKKGYIMRDEPPPRTRNGIKIKTDDLKAIEKELNKLRKPFLKEHPTCEINSPHCTTKATEIHHMAGRGPNEVLDQTTWKACCANCNRYVETHHNWAKELGLKNSRHILYKKKFPGGRKK